MDLLGPQVSRDIMQGKNPYLFAAIKSLPLSALALSRYRRQLETRVTDLRERSSSIGRSRTLLPPT